LHLLHLAPSSPPLQVLMYRLRKDTLGHAAWSCIKWIVSAACPR
jgi:hypothetical protein